MTTDARGSSAVPDSRMAAAWRRIAASGRQRALLLGLAYAALATPLDNLGPLGRGDTLAAVVWPAPALAVAWLWRVPRGEWAPALAAIGIVMLGVGWFDQLPLWANAGFAVLNAFGVWLCLVLARRFIGARGELDTTVRFTRFLLLLPGLGVLVVALLGGALASAEHGTRWLDEGRAIMGSNGLAMLIIVPGVLAWSRAAEPELRAPPWWLVVIPALCAGVLLVEAFRVRLPDELEHGLLALVLIWAAVYGSMRAATLAAFTLASTGIVLTVTGNGSYHQEGLAGIQQLQIDLAVLATLVFFVAVGLTERRQYALRLARAHQLESLGMLASGIAHDFNNVLAAIRGYAEYAEELLPDAAGADAVRRPLRQTLAAVHRGRDMTEQMLLAVGRGAARRSERVSMRTALDEALALAQPQRGGTAPVVISCRIDTGLAEAVPDASDAPDAPDASEVVGDPGQLIRLLVNLLRNAVQAAHGTVAVRLSSAEQGGGTDRGADGEYGADADQAAVGQTPRGRVIRVDISDDGPGIPAPLMQEIFEPFFSTRLGGGGHGLGLSIAASIAADHGGGIRCGRGALGGARFRVILPAAPTREAPLELAAGPPSESGAGVPLGCGECVLLVDDDAELRTLLEDWLAELGFAPAGYDTAPAALAALRADPDAVALLISDIELPGLRGEVLVETARACAPALAVLLISGAPRGAEIARAAGLPFLAKPFGRTELAHAIRALGTLGRDAARASASAAADALAHSPHQPDSH